MTFFEHLAIRKDLVHSRLVCTRNLMTIGRKLVGDPFSESEESYVKMYMAACFNKKPPIPHATVHTWDINIMLDFLQKYGSNSKLSVNHLAGKLALLLMFSQMCRIGEIQQLDLNHMQDVVERSLTVWNSFFRN